MAKEKREDTQVQVFQAVLQKGDRALGWTIASVPFQPAKVWPKRIGLRVRGTLAGRRGAEFAFRTSLFPVEGATGAYYLLVNRAMQAGAGVGLGSAVEFRLSPDLEPRPAELPDELAVLLDEADGLRAWYDALTEYTRREIGKWVLGVKSDAARLRRSEAMAERLLATMEAERELPPLIEAAFRQRPRARTGWAKLSARQRQTELMAVFYYVTPESRAKRLAKLCDLAESKA